MPSGVSIVICCHNSAGRLPETLRHLAAQQVSIATDWEVVVVDNASTDDTAGVAQNLWTRPDVPLRVVAEPQPGLSHARICGVRAAKYGIISFVDDDNRVCADWLQNVVEIFSQDSNIGIAGGPSEAAFENAPPPWFESIKGNYAVGAQHSATGDVTEAPGTLLWGAGLNIRKAAIEALFDNGFQFFLSGRSGNKPLAGEDSEICFALRAGGWKFWYDERLLLKHSIPASRLTWSYACKLMRGMGNASALFNIYLIALGKHPFGPEVPSFKKNWGFQFLKAIRDLAKLLLLHPLDCISRREGSRAALHWEAGLGNLSALLAIRSRYKDTIQRIRQAKWNKGGVRV
jgi:glycosyltransferase involved in cell wall biosynthesis